MTALALIGLAAVLAIVFFLLVTCWRQTLLIAELQSAHGKPRARGAEHAACPAHPRFGELLADTPPDGVRALVKGRPAVVGGELPPVPADRPVTPARAGGHPPWTGEIPAAADLDGQYRAWLARTAAEQAEAGRVEWARAQLESLRADPTDTGVMRVFNGLRAMPHGTEMLP